MKKRGIILFTLGIFFCIFTSQVWGEFKLTPSISLREEYDDNIFLTADNEEEDFVTTIIPGISLGYDTERLRFSLNYSFIAWLYMHNSRENDISHNVQLDSTLTVLRDFLFLKVTDAYSRVTIDQRRQVVQDNRFVNTTDSNNIIVNPYIELPLSGTLKTKVGYTYENQWYKEEKGNKFTDHIFTGGFIKELTSRITASLFYTYTIHQPDIFGDYKRQDVVLGASYQISPKLSFNGSYGYAWFNYEEGNDRNSPTWDVNANYRLTDMISLGVGYSQNFSDSVNAGTYKREAFFASITRQGTVQFSLRGFKERGAYIEEDREDESTGVAATASYPITPNLTVRVTGLYTYYKFLPEEEKVNRYGAGLSLDYALRITTVSIGYTYNLNSSTVDKNDYKNNIVWVQAKLTF